MKLPVGSPWVEFLRAEAPSPPDRPSSLLCTPICIRSRDLLNDREVKTAYTYSSHLVGTEALYIRIKGRSLKALYN